MWQSQVEIGRKLRLIKLGFLLLCFGISGKNKFSTSLVKTLLKFNFELSGLFINNTSCKVIKKGGQKVIGISIYDGHLCYYLFDL